MLPAVHLSSENWIWTWSTLLSYKNPYSSPASNFHCFIKLVICNWHSLKHSKQSLKLARLLSSLVFTSCLQMQTIILHHCHKPKSVYIRNHNTFPFCTAENFSVKHSIRQNLWTELVIFGVWWWEGWKCFPLLSGVWSNCTRLLWREKIYIFWSNMLSLGIPDGITL